MNYKIGLQPCQRRLLSRIVRKQQLMVLLISRWQLIVIASVVALVILLVTYTPVLPLYRTTITFGVNQAPLESAYVDDEERYYGWVTSEYGAIVLADWGNATNFLTDLRWRLWLHGYRFELAELSELILFTVESTRVKVNIEHIDPTVLNALAQATGEAFVAFENSQIPQLHYAPATVKQFDRLILMEPAEVTIREQLELPLRVLLGMGFGPLLASFLNRRKRRIDSAQMVETLDLPILGKIPRSDFLS